MADWLGPLLMKLDRVRQVDHEWLAHGAHRHRYRFGPRLAPSLLEWFEAKYDIRLPDQYRQFLMEAGNGGAGPHIGLQRFGYLANQKQTPFSLGTGIQRSRVEPSGLKRQWEERYLPDGSLTDEFEVTYYDSMYLLAGGCDALSKPFPFVERSVTNEQVEQILSEPTTEYDENDTPRWNYPGSLHLAEYGCGAIQILALNGPFAGSVWMDDRGNDNGCFLVADSFAEWYDQWLDSVFAFCARSLNYRRLLSLHVTYDLAEAQAVEAELTSSGIRCEVESKPSKTIVVLVDKDQQERAKPLIESVVNHRK